MKQAAMGTDQEGADAPGGEQQAGDGRSRSAGGGEPVEEVRKLRLQKERLEGLCRVLQGQIKAQKSQQSQLDLDPVLQGQQQVSAAVTASVEEEDEGDVRLPPPPQLQQQQQDTEAPSLEACSGGESGV